MAVRAAETKSLHYCPFPSSFLFSICAKIFFFTSASPGVLISCALAHGAEELVDLFEGQRVVQRLQWVNGGHHGAAFKACSRAEERRCPEAHQEAPGKPGSCSLHPITTLPQPPPASKTTTTFMSPPFASKQARQKPCWTPNAVTQVHTAQTCSPTKPRTMASKVKNPVAPLAFWVSPTTQSSSTQLRSFS